MIDDMDFSNDEWVQFDAFGAQSDKIGDIFIESYTLIFGYDVVCYMIRRRLKDGFAISKVDKTNISNQILNVTYVKTNTHNRLQQKEFCAKFDWFKDLCRGRGSCVDCNC